MALVIFILLIALIISGANCANSGPYISEEAAGEIRSMGMGGYYETWNAKCSGTECDMANISPYIS